MMALILLLYLAEDIPSSFVRKSRPFSIATLLLLCVIVNTNTMVKTGGLDEVTSLDTGIKLGNTS